MIFASKIINIISLCTIMLCSSAFAKFDVKSANPTRDISPPVFASIESECNWGDAQSCAFLTKYYLCRGNDEENIRKACLTAEKACSLGEFSDCKSAARSYDYCHENTPDRESKLQTLYTQGCKGNDAFSCYQVALATPKSETIIYLKNFARACELDPNGEEGSACRSADSLYDHEFGLSNGSLEVKNIYKRACALNRKAACRALTSKRKSQF